MALLTRMHSGRSDTAHLGPPKSEGGLWSLRLGSKKALRVGYMVSWRNRHRIAYSAFNCGNM